MKRLLTLSLAALLAAGLTACGAAEERGVPAAKPVLYLYPEEETEVTVTLDFDGTLTSTYPDYGDGWTVTARPVAGSVRVPPGRAVTVQPSP